MLQRASNLLTSNGNPAAAIADIFVERVENTSESNIINPASPGFGATLKRKLQGAKHIPIVRSISLRSSPGPGSLQRQSRRHTRAFSTDSSTTRPKLLHTNSPESINMPSNDPHILPTEPLTQSPKPSLSPPQLTPRSSMADVDVPQLLQNGVPMMKVSASRQKTHVFRLDPDQGQIFWESKKSKISARNAIYLFCV
jgi:phosphatidylinositol phospholipase C delta